MSEGRRRIICPVMLGRKRADHGVGEYTADGPLSDITHRVDDPKGFSGLIWPGGVPVFRAILSVMQCGWLWVVLHDRAGVLGQNQPFRRFCLYG
jgi:hypothetical protein